MLQACGECGAILAGCDDARVRAGAELGRNFGIAFQIIDDLLDYGFGALNLDKRTFSDLKNGNVTLPLILFFAECSAQEKAKMKELLANSQLEGNQVQIKRMLEAHGAFEKARDIAVERINSCMPFLEACRTPKPPATCARSAAS